MGIDGNWLGCKGQKLIGKTILVKCISNEVPISGEVIGIDKDAIFIKYGERELESALMIMAYAIESVSLSIGDAEELIGPDFQPQ